MKKNLAWLPAILLFSILESTSNSSFAQVKGGQHTKLFDLYAMEKYEDCAFKAESMVMNEKYKKDPEPLLYLSMCMLKVSKMDSSELDQHYKDPLKESLKYAKKFRSKDKDGTMYKNNLHFFDELKEAGIYQANSFYNQNQYGKAAAFFGMVNAFDDKDNNVRFMKGVCDILAKNAADGAKNINDAMKGLSLARMDTSYKPDEVSGPLLIEAMIIYSDYLSKNKMEDSAKKTMTAAKEFFPESLEVKNQYNLLHGLPPEEKPIEEDATKKTEKKYEFHQPKENENIQVPTTQSEAETPVDSTKQENIAPGEEINIEPQKEDATPESTPENRRMRR